MVRKNATPPEGNTEEEGFIEVPFVVQRPEDSQFTNTIIYGDTGAGKTHLLGTAVSYEDTSPMLLLDVEGGTKTLRGVDIDVVRPLSWKEIQDVYDFLRHENHHYKSIGVDSLTELQKKYSLGTILGDIKEGESDYTHLGDTVVPTRQDWLKTGDQMRKFIRAFKELAYIKTEGDPIHVFMTCLEKTDEKKNTVGPMFSGQLSLESGAYVDVLARLSCIPVEEDGPEGEDPIIVPTRHLLVDVYVNPETDMRFLAKNRGSDVRQIWEPTIQKIVEMGRHIE